MGPKNVRSTILSPEKEAVCIDFHQHTVLSPWWLPVLITSKYSKIDTSSLHKLFQRHNISRLPEVNETKQLKKNFQSYPIGYFQIDIAEVRTAEGKLYLFVAIDRTSKFVWCMNFLNSMGK